VTIIAPLTTWSFTFVRRHRPHRSTRLLAGDLRDRAPERHPARATDGGGHDRIATAITASPVAAATAAMIGLFSEKG